MNLRNFALSPLVVALSLTVGLTACSDGSSLSKTEVATSEPRTNLDKAYSYQLVFEDVATGTPITDDLQVVFSGPAVDAGLVVDANNASVKSKTVTTNTGLLSVATDFDATNTEFSVSVGNAEKGWTKTGVQVSKDTSVTGNQVITVKLINPTAAADINANEDLGLAVATQTLTAPADGSVTAETVALETPTKAATDDEGNSENIGSAKISLPADVSALDENGNKINLVGAISATTVKFGNNSTASMSAFPGGFTPTVVDANGQTDSTGAFITGGFAQFNLTDSAGTPLKKFDKPLTLTIDLPKTSVNPNTDQTVMAGDTYPVWSYDETSGQWKFEADGVVSEKTPVDADNFQVSFESTHLSYWNLDYYGSTCQASLTLNRSTSDTRPLTVELTGVRGLRFSRTLYDVTDSQQTLNRYPKNQRVNVVVRDQNNAIIARASSLSLCNGGSVNIPAPPANVSYANLVVNTTESCPSGTNSRPSPTFVAFYANRHLYSGYAQSSTGSSVATITLASIPNGSSGTLYAYNPLTYRYETRALTVTAPSTTAAVNFPNLSCQIVSGGSGTGN